MVELPDLEEFQRRLLMDEAILSANNHRGHLVIELATVSLLVDAGLVTVEEAAQRIELVQSALQTDPEHPVQNQIVLAATTWLRERASQKAPRWRPVLHEGGRQDPEED